MTSNMFLLVAFTLFIGLSSEVQPSTEPVKARSSGPYSARYVLLLLRQNIDHCTGETPPSSGPNFLVAKPLTRFFECAVTQRTAGVSIPFVADQIASPPVPIVVQAAHTAPIPCAVDHIVLLLARTAALGAAIAPPVLCVKSLPVVTPAVTRTSIPLKETRLSLRHGSQAH